MNKKDLQTLNMLRDEFEKGTESAKIPLRLQKESVVTALKTYDQKQTDFSDKTGTKHSNIVMLRKLTAIAAMLAIVIAGVLVMRAETGVQVIKTDSFYEGYKSEAPVKNAKSYDEVKRAVREILGTADLPQTKPSKTEQNTADATGSSKSETQKSLLGGYGKYVAEAITAGSDKSPDVKINSSQVVSGYDDFEADIVKTNGEYLYILTTGTSNETNKTLEQIKIVKAVPASEMSVVSTIVLSNSSKENTVDECREIYLKDNNLIAIMKSCSYSTHGPVSYESVSTVALYYDISDPAAPEKIREHIQDGEYVSSKLNGKRLCLVTAKSIPEISLEAAEDEIIPSFKINGSIKTLAAENIFIAVNDPEASYLFVTVTDISNLTAPVGNLAILGSGKESYCSDNAVLVSRNFVSVEEEKNGEHKSLTEIYRFNISGTKIKFVGSYIVEGTLIGGLTVDEKTGYLRAATSGTDAGNIWIINDKMQFVSGLKHIFPNEKIESVKFIGSKGYVAAGEKTMIIDFSDSAKPKVAGTISESSFSDMLYEISDSVILGIDKTKTEKGNKISFTLFDVSDSENPVEVSAYELPEGCTAPPVYDSRCVMVDYDKKLFGVPVVSENSEKGTETTAYMLFDVSDNQISLEGVYEHDNDYIGDAAIRSICIGNTLYTVSGEKVVAFSSESHARISFAEIR